VQVHVAPDLRHVVRLGVLTFDGASNLVGDARLDAPLAAAERAVRDAPPEESLGRPFIEVARVEAAIIVESSG